MKLAADGANDVELTLTALADLTYPMRVTAYVIKPVDSLEFAEVTQQMGIFRDVADEPPPGSFAN